MLSANPTVRRSLVFAALLIVFLVSFLIVEGMNIPVLTNPDFLKESKGSITALGGIALLILDIFLPVPSSLVMIANGAFFGIVGGFALSMVGGMGASLIGFFLGRTGSRWVSRIASEEEIAKSESLMRKWGTLAIIITRPVPLLAETTAIIAGTAGSISIPRMCLASALGLIPAALIYAVAGNQAAHLDAAGIYSFLLVILIAGIFWLLGRFIQGLAD